MMSVPYLPTQQGVAVPVLPKDVSVVQAQVTDNLNRAKQSGFRETNYTKLRSCEFFNTTQFGGDYRAVNSTSTLTAIAPDGAHEGIVQIAETGAAAGTDAGSWIGADITSMFLRGGEAMNLIFRWMDTRTGSKGRIGFWGGTYLTGTSTTIPNGLFLELTGAGNDVTIQAIARNATAETIVNSYTLPRNTWVMASVELNEARSTATFTLTDDAGTVLFSWTTTSNIPASTVSVGELSAFWDASTTTGTLAHLDRMGGYRTKALTRGRLN